MASGRARISNSSQNSRGPVSRSRRFRRRRIRRNRQERSQKLVARYSKAFAESPPTSAIRVRVAETVSTAALCMVLRIRIPSLHTLRKSGNADFYADTYRPLCFLTPSALPPKWLSFLPRMSHEKQACKRFLAFCRTWTNFFFCRRYALLFFS